ncbi:MAG: hypothetical protein HYV96_04115 [Opitutae bacterium]|nr:hypothetical protein [Opitutae bacterium]
MRFTQPRSVAITQALSEKPEAAMLALPVLSEPSARAIAHETGARVRLLLEKAKRRALDVVEQRVVVGRKVRGADRNCQRAPRGQETAKRAAKRRAEGETGTEQHVCRVNSKAPQARRGWRTFS